MWRRQGKVKAAVDVEEAGKGQGCSCCGGGRERSRLQLLWRRQGKVKAALGVEEAGKGQGCI